MLQRASSLLWKYIHPSHTGVIHGDSRITMYVPPFISGSLYQSHLLVGLVTHGHTITHPCATTHLSVFNLGNARIQHSHQGFDAVRYPVTELG